MILTDGSPDDIDERVPLHSQMAAKKVAEELHSQGLINYCNTLDPSAHPLRPTNLWTKPLFSH